MIYILPGIPIALARARIGVGKRPWDCQKKQKAHYGLLLETQHAGEPLYQGALHVDITFFFPFPQTISKSKIEKMRGKCHTFRPDLSNLIKFVEDIGSGVLYPDDSLISSIVARKCYDDVPRTEFMIKVLHHE
jgi:Holliday junction resolvase RusA-like endonuclease